MKSKDYIDYFYKDFEGLEINGSSDCESFFDKIQECLTLCQSKEKKLMFIGNGASASMSSHYTLDFWKNGKIRAINFNDHASLTAIGNDIDYESVFSFPTEKFGDKGDILISISSSGNSPNILKAVKQAKEMGITNITLSGMKPDNKLRNLGDFNIYFPGKSYGFVESGHHLLIHQILDCFIKRQSKNG